ncbi:LacI family DNA-binding transcriptional regulator [Dongshaea marina]|uniref:LacI family DNA-binding transcriptional regulator n=1 Tax=Dongshaea marina TaxID=2047966 RepID=UPI000D3EA04E|nr:LacI family DNA-binding transcriptional regulator [Dongshaea marina]
MATITEVSRLAKVSKASVSRVLSGRRGVKEQTRQAVLRAVEELNYRPNQLAQSLATRVSNGIGIFTLGMNDLQLGRTLRQLEAALAQYHRYPILAIDADDQNTFIHKLQSLAARSCDAIVLIGQAIPPEWARALRDLNLPPIIGLNQPLDDPALCVNFDFEDACEVLCNYLFSQGHTQIACIYEENFQGKALLAGYRSALELRALPFNRQLLITPEQPIRIITQLLKLPHPYTALICRDQFEAEAIREAAKQFNLNIPQQLSLVSACSFQQPPPSFITGITLPEQEITAALMDRVDEAVLCQSHELQESHLFQGTLSLAESVSSPKG